MAESGAKICCVNIIIGTFRSVGRVKTNMEQYDAVSAIYNYNEDHSYLYTSVEKYPMEWWFWGVATLYRKVVANTGLHAMIVVVL